jgi:hypothetical protein
VEGTAPLAMSVAQQGKSSEADWSALALPSTALPAAGDLTLTASGKVPATTPSQPAEMDFTAGTLTLNLQPHKTDGTAVDPALVQVPCTLADGQEPVLAKIPVTAATVEPSPDKPAAPVVGPNPPASPGAVTPLAAVVTKLHYELTASTTITKLNAVVDLGKGSMDANYTLGPPPDFDAHVVGKTRLNPAKGSFLNFGFVPATAMMEFIPGPTNVVLHKQKATGTAIMDIRIYDLKVNGVPLDVGPNCRTAKSITINLVSGPGFSVLGGGPISGTFDTPPFHGCGATEPLDNLLTGLVSGPGSTASILLGRPCNPATVPTCAWKDPNT